MPTFKEQLDNLVEAFQMPEQKSRVPFLPTPTGAPIQKESYKIPITSARVSPLPKLSLNPKPVIDKIRDYELKFIAEGFPGLTSNTPAPADIIPAFKQGATRVKKQLTEFNTSLRDPKKLAEISLNATMGAVDGPRSVVRNLLKPGEVPEMFLKNLAREKNPQVIENTLRSVGLDEVNARTLAPQLAPTKTLQEVKDVIIGYERAGTVPKSPEPANATPQEMLAIAEKNAAEKHLKFTPEGNPTPYTAKERALVGTGKSNLPALTTKPPTIKPPKVPEQPAVPKGIWDTGRRELHPLKYVDPETADVFRQWNAENIKGKEFSNQTAQDTRIPGDSMDLINRYQSGDNIPEVKQIFDDLFDQAKKAGIDVPYRQNYVPQVYKESYPKIKESISKYLTDHGVTDEQAKSYIEGASQLDPEVAKRLKLSPTFEKERVFANYKIAGEYGLHPKYEKVSDLAAHYKGELEKVKANNKLINTLKEKGLLKPAESQSVPKDWEIVNSEFSSRLYKAPPNVAKVINNIFPKPSGLFGKIVDKVGEVSGMAQNIALSGGMPGTNVNFFAIGQLNKELHTGNVKAVNAFLKTNSKSATAKYFNEHKQTLLDMADQNIDVTLRAGSFGQDKIMDLIKDKEFTKALGLSVDKTFGAKTFQGMMPMMQVQIFEDVYKASLKKGLSTEEAKKLAGDIVKKNFGMNADDFARSGTTRDTLKAIFFAPRFRESIINSLTNTGKAGVDFIWQLGGLRGKVDPTLSRNRRLLTGMIISFAAYNLINKKLNGDYMWENPENRKFALRVPLPNGDVTYVEFMPSYLAFARNMATGALNLGTGDFKGATQKFGSVFSIPIKLTTEAIGNSDYFGRKIYEDTDSGPTKALKIAQHLGLGVAHPYIKEIVNQVQDKKPLYQSIITGMELPLKFSSKDKEEANKVFNLMDEQNKKRAERKELAEEKYEELKALPKEEANKQVAEIYKTDPKLFEKIKDMKEADAMGLTKNEKYIKMLDNEYRAKYIYDQVFKMQTKEEKNAYISDLIKKKVMSKDTYAELAKLIKQSQ